MIQKKGLRISEIEKKISDIFDTIEIIKDNLPSDTEHKTNHCL